MSNLRKIRRQTSLTPISKRTTPPVFIVKPHNVEGKTYEETNIFIMRAFQRGIAEYHHVPTKVAELGRNFGIHEFLAKHPKKTHIYFQDDDSPPMGAFAIEQLLRLNKPVVCGVTPIVRVEDKRINCMWSAVLDKDGKKENIGIDELPKRPFRVHRTGGNCLLIRRDVLLKMKPPYQITTYNKMWLGVDLSEDFYFCDRIREAGYEIWCDPDVRCHHFHDFDLLNVFAIYEQCQKMR